MPSIALEVSALPDCLRAALASVGYGRKDVSVSPAEHASLSVSAGDGQKGFAIVVNLATGERRELTGSWGGSNPFQSSPVDSDNAVRPMPEHGAIVRGILPGYRPCYATIDVHPAAFAPLLPAKSDVTERESHILFAFRGLNSKGRADYFRDNPVADSELSALVSRGYLTQNKAGARAITTTGKNASSRDGFRRW